jgi:predicted DNA-binding transcriptional regulator YafY
LDRIQGLEVTTEVFKPITGFHADDYFKYSFGISVSNKLSPETIVLSFTAQQGAYVLSQPLHTTQELVSQSDDAIVVSITVIPSFELKSQLLSYGSSVRVLEPQWLKQEITDEALSIITQSK